MTTTTTTTDTSTDTTSTAMSPEAHLNGVDIPSLFATIGVVRDQPALAQFQFRASSTWLNGTHSRSSIEGFSGAGGEQHHHRTFSFDADHPAVLTGADNGPTPVEFLLVALASCLTAGIANIAAARKIELQSVEADVEGDIDLQGILGLSHAVRNGYQAMRVSFRIAANATPEQIAALVEQSRARSAVFDVITCAVPVHIDVSAV